jgi:trimethylamine--corrinoid protein Co-methyltransferase
MLAGVHIVNECVGLLDSILTVSYEKILMDEEMMSRAFCIVEGLRTSEEALALDVLREVGHEGSFLTHPSTLKHFREAWRPTVSDSGTYSEWVKAGSEDTPRRADRRVQEILAGCPECLLSPSVDKDLQRFVEARR